MSSLLIPLVTVLIFTVITAGSNVTAPVCEIDITAPNLQDATEDKCGCATYQKLHCSGEASCKCVRPERCSGTTDAIKTNDTRSSDNQDVSCLLQPTCQFPCCSDSCKDPNFCPFGGTCVYRRIPCPQRPCCPMPVCIPDRISCDLVCIAQEGYRCRLLQNRNCDVSVRRCICASCSIYADGDSKFCV